MEREVLVSSTLLRDFVELQGRPESEYLAFGRRWGLLGLCEHGLPASHASGAKRIEPGFRLSLLPEGCQGEGREAIRDWRSHVDRFRALLDIGGILSWDNTAPVSKWFELKPPETSEQRWRGFHGQSVKSQRVAAERLLNLLVEVAAVRPIVRWGSRLEIEFGGGIRGLYAPLVVQLLRAISQADFAVCSACGSWYPPPRRRPKRGQNRYCLECKRTGSARIHSNRASREKKRLSEDS